MRIKYTYDDLRLIHPLWYTVIAAQALGAIADLLLQQEGRVAPALLSYRYF
ncbi:hypothetical protein H8K52_13625 [Undibacterium seohonense]|uniref:Uncharacterized protein n=1 Tax=Undibacterium seohonense TaxID=1344950 RepID=A0ABR6X6C2_9BURK|nr:hypothetical protein [Undibacterium seohonense]MBC3808380.1 hypothetical protein [Undibacterium seohonense]